MPWGHPYGTAVCDDCEARTKDVYTGKKQLKLAGCWCPDGEGGEKMWCPVCLMSDACSQRERDQRLSGRTSLEMTVKKAWIMFDEHWDPAPGTPSRTRTPPRVPPGLDRKGRRGQSEAREEGLEVCIQQLEKEVEELKTLVKHQDAILKQVADKVAMWSWLETDAGAVLSRPQHDHVRRGA